VRHDDDDDYDSDGDGNDGEVGMRHDDAVDVRYDDTADVKQFVPQVSYTIHHQPIFLSYHYHLYHSIYQSFSITPSTNTSSSSLTMDTSAGRGSVAAQSKPGRRKSTRG